VTDANLLKAAALLSKAWNTEEFYPPLPDDCFPKSIDEAYEIQDLIASQIDDEVIGWKIGFPPTGAISGRIFSKNLYNSPTVLSSLVHPQPNLECEIAFQITQTPPPALQSYIREDFASIMRAYIAVELTGRRIYGAPHGPSNEWEVRDIIADNSGGAGLVVGSELCQWQDLNFSDIFVDLEIDNKIIEAIPTARERDLIMVVVNLANQLKGRGIVLKIGDYISTGSLTVPTRLPVGASARAIFSSIGQINLRLE
jgi:2-keto-4-pentenoate hydratase